MGNKLKKMLDKNDNGFVVTMHFKNQEDRQSFINAINKVGETGQHQAIPNPKSLELKKSNGDYNYPFINMNNIMDMMIYPSQEIVELPIIIDEVQEKYSFLRVVTHDSTLLHSFNSKVVDVKLELKVQNNSMNFTYTSHPENAKNLDELILEYKRFLALVDLLFGKTEKHDKVDDMEKFFKQSLNAYQRAKELSEVLEIKLTPKMIIEEDDKECQLEKLYLLLVKNSIIRLEGKLNHIEMANIDNLEEGQELFATFNQNEEWNIFGHNKMIYRVNCVFGAEIKKVEPKEDGKSMVYFKDSEKKPMYIAYTAFLNKEEAENEMNKILEKRKQYEKAISWIDQLRELLNT